MPQEAIQSNAVYERNHIDSDVRNIEYSSPVEWITNIVQMW